MRHHQEADRIHAELARRLDMLARDVGLGAMGGDAHAARAGLISALQVMHSADAGQQQHRRRARQAFAGDGGDPFGVVMRAETVIEGRAGDAVAMADLDGVDAGAVERARRWRAPASRLYW